MSRLLFSARQASADGRVIDPDDGQDFFDAGGQNHFIGLVEFFQSDIAQFDFVREQLDDLGAGDAEQQTLIRGNPATVFVDESIAARAFDDLAIDGVNGIDGGGQAPLRLSLGDDAGNIIDRLGFGQDTSLLDRGNGRAPLMRRSGQRMKRRDHNKQTGIAVRHEAVWAVPAGEHDTDAGFGEGIATQRLDDDFGKLLNIPGASQLDERGRALQAAQMGHQLKGGRRRKCADNRRRQIREGWTNRWRAGLRCQRRGTRRRCRRRS